MKKRFAIFTLLSCFFSSIDLYAQEIDLSSHSLALNQYLRESGDWYLSKHVFSTYSLQKEAPSTSRKIGRSEQKYEEYGVYRSPIYDPHKPYVYLPTNDMLRLWDISLGRETRRFPIEREHSSRGKDWAAISDAKNNRIIGSRSRDYTTGQGGVIITWDLSTGERVQEIDLPDELAARHISLSPDGNSLLCSAGRGATRIECLQLCNLTTGSLGKQFDYLPVVYLDNERLVGMTSGRKPQLSVRNIKSDQVLMHRDLPESSSSVVMAIDSSKRYLATARIATAATSARDEYVVILWDARQFKEIRRFTIPYDRNKSGRWRVEFSRDSKQLLVSICGWNEVKSVLLDIETGACLAVFPIESAAFVAGTEFIAGLIEHTHTVELWSTEGKRVVELIPISAERHWAIKTNAGYFDASPLTLKFMKENQDSLDLGRDTKFIDEFYRPELVKLVLQGVPQDILEQLPHGYACPTAGLRLSSTSKQSARIALTGNVSGKGATLTNVSLSRKDRQFPKETLAQLAHMKTGEPTTDQTFEIPFSPGKNQMTLTATVTDSFGVKSKTATLTVERSEHVEELSGRLFVLSVGVSKHKYPEYDLKFPAVDAQALAQEFAKQEGLTFGEVHTQVYTDKKATLANLRDGLSWLERVCTPEDVAVVFFAGHGIKGRRGLYYVTHEGDAEAMQYSCLNWEEVAKTLKAVKAKQTLFLSDACYAGGFAKTQLAMQRDLAENLQTIDNLLVFASSGAEETSLEDEAWGHGAFTVSLLAALAGKSDSDNDGNVSLKELVQYTTQATHQLTNSAQTPFVATTGSYDSTLSMARAIKQDNNQLTVPPLTPPHAVELEPAQRK